PSVVVFSSVYAFAAPVFGLRSSLNVTTWSPAQTAGPRNTAPGTKGEPFVANWSPSKRIDIVALAIVNDCCTWGATWNVPLPAWFASTTQVPAPIRLTSEPVALHAPGVALASIVNTTGLPDAPPVALTGYEPPTTAAAGGVDVIVMCCGVSGTTTDC